MRRVLVIAMMACVTLALSSCAGQGLDAPPRVQVMTSMSAVKAVPGSTFRNAVTIVIPADFYIKADSLRVKTPQMMGVVFDEVVPPPPTEMLDVLGHTSPVYRGELGIPLSGRVAVGAPRAKRTVDLVVTYQGCSKTLCLRPRSDETSFDLEIGEGTNVSAAGVPTQKTTLRSLLSSASFEAILDHGLLWTLLIVFIAGLVTALTPCVWPLIPVMLVIIGVERQHSFLRNFLLAASMVAGLVLVYALLGIGAVALGMNLGFMFQQRWFLFVIAGFFVVMALSMFGLFHVHLSKRWEHLLHSLGGKGFRGAFLSGLGLGLVASPCTGPVIAGLLAYVALQGSYAMGFGYLVLYGIGMGLVFILLGAGYGVLVDHIRSGGWMNWMKRLLGLVMLVPAAFYLSTALGIGTARPPADGPHVAWLDNLDHAKRFAEEAERPIMLEFSADWCAPCRALERTFFRRPKIVRLTMQLVPVRIDGTYESKELRALMDEYCVVGFPTILFLDSKGMPYNDLRVTFANRSLLEDNMREAIQRVESGAQPGDRGECEDPSISSGQRGSGDGA